jgi:hypothetical protein
MDWIERLLNVAPDNGNGTLEAAIIVAAIVVASGLIPQVRRRLVDFASAPLDRVRHAGR